MMAFMAPDDVPDTPSITNRSSLKRCSSTPQVKAPKEPPPCKASDRRSGARGGEAFAPVMARARSIIPIACSLAAPERRWT